jgi:predicted phage tail protein
MAEEPGARITLKELYLQVQKIQSMIEKLSNQFPGITQQLNDLERDVHKRLSDHEERIRKVEMRVWQMMAIAGFLAAIVPIILRLLP